MHVEQQRLHNTSTGPALRVEKAASVISEAEKQAREASAIWSCRSIGNSGCSSKSSILPSPGKASPLTPKGQPLHCSITDVRENDGRGRHYKPSSLLVCLITHQQQPHAPLEWYILATTLRLETGPSYEVARPLILHDCGPRKLNNSMLNPTPTASQAKM